MNEQRGGGGGGKADCYYHLNEVFVGVCPSCLYERLLVLSAKQGGHTKHSTNLRKTTTIDHNNNNKTSIVVLPKLFTLTSLFNRFESSSRRHNHRKKSQNDDDDDDCSSTLSQDDSFISIQFENNGAGSWEKNKVSKVSLDQCNIPWKNNNQNLNNKGGGSKTSTVEHVKPKTSSLRWRKRIGQIFHVMRLKKGNKRQLCHVGSKKVQGVKVRKGCIRTLTKRREPKKNKGV